VNKNEWDILLITGYYWSIPVISLICTWMVIFGWNRMRFKSNIFLKIPFHSKGQDRNRQKSNLTHAWAVLNCIFIFIRYCFLSCRRALWIMNHAHLIFCHHWTNPFHTNKKKFYISWKTIWVECQVKLKPTVSKNNFKLTQVTVFDMLKGFWEFLTLYSVDFIFFTLALFFQNLLKDTRVQSWVKSKPTILQNNF